MSEIHLIKRWLKERYGMYEPKVCISKNQVQKREMKNWILLNTDLKTPRLIDIGGNDKFDSNSVMYCIVKAADRQEAIKFMHWIHESLRNEVIIEPMVVEIKNIEFQPAKICY